MAGVGNFSLLHKIEMGCGAYPGSEHYAYLGEFSQGKSGRCVKPTTHLHLVPKLGMVELLVYVHCSVHLHGVVYN
jgi:hypothetical protein